MQKAIKRFIYFLTVVALIFAAVYSSGAVAVQKVKKYPISIVTTDELYGTTKIEKNQVVIETCLGIVDKKNGYGHVMGHPDWTMYYGDIRYKKKRLKPKTKVLTIFPCDPTDDNEERFGYYFIKTKWKDGKKHWTLLYVSEEG